MGFYVDVSEMKEATQQYLKAAETAQEALNKAKNAMNGIITSNSMYGQVGQAIANDINNSQNAIIVGLKNSYKILGSEYQQTFQEFLSTTGETSESAIISEETLNTAKNDLNNMLSTHSERRRAVKSVYSDISDLVNLSMPSNKFKESKSTAEKHLDKIIENVNTFDSAEKEGNTVAIVSALKQQISAAEMANDLSYTDPRFMEFVSQDQLANAMKDIDNNIKKAENEAKQAEIKARKKRKEEWAKRHPLTSWLKDRSAEIGSFWNDVVAGTRALPLNNTDKQTLLALEGLIERAGNLVSSVAISGSELLQLSGELLNRLDNLVLGTAIPQWQLDDLHGAWNNTKSLASSLGTMSMGLATLLTPELESIPMFKNAKTQTVNIGKEFVGDLWHAIKTGDSYALGGYVFDIGSMFVGAGEVSAAVKGSSFASKLAKGANTFKTASKATSVSKLGKVTSILDKTMKYGDDAAKALGNKLSKIPIPVVDEFVDSNGYLTKVIGKGDLGDYAKVSKSDIAKGKNVGKYKKASGAKGKLDTSLKSFDSLTMDEKKVVESLLEQGKNVQLIPEAPNVSKTPDLLVNGVKTEIKTLNGNNINTLVTKVGNALKQVDGTGEIIYDISKANFTLKQMDEIISRLTGKYGKDVVNRITFIK